MIELKQLPDAIRDAAKAAEFAAVEALTKTAQKGRDAARQSLKDNFTLRNEFTARGITITPAKFGDPNPFAEVYVRDKYIAEQETGGTRPVKDEGTPVPAEIYEAANIARDKVIVKSLRAKKVVNKNFRGNKPFVQKVNNTVGVWVRETAARNPIKLLYVLLTTPKRITKRPWFEKPVEEAFNKNIQREFEEAQGRAMERYLRKYLG